MFGTYFANKSKTKSDFQFSVYFDKNELEEKIYFFSLLEQKLFYFIIIE